MTQHDHISPRSGRVSGGTSRIRRRRSAVRCALAVLFIAAGLQAQTGGKISGTVTDGQTGEALIGVNILVVGTTMGAATDIDGKFFILNIPAGKYDLQASIVGYQRIINSGVIVNSDRTTTVDFALTSAAIEQEAVVVQATRPDVEPEKTSTSEIIRFDDVQNIAGMRDVGDVIGLAADVTDGHFRGGRTGEELYTLQGMGITNPLDNSSAILPIMSAVEEVEVVTSGFGVQYGNAQSGVVNISMKEGKSDKWRTRIETRGRGTGRKHFGPSVFDPRSNPYLAFLSDTSAWRRSQGESAAQFYTAMVDQFNTLFGLDTAARARVAYALWRYQTKRDINLDYGKDIDNSVEIATGGPVSENLRMFMALRSNTQWPVFPTEQPDLEQQIMGNVVMDLGDGAALRVSGAVSRERSNVFPSSNNLGYYDWIWDRLLAIQYRNRVNDQIGIRYSKAVSASTFYEIKLNSLFTTMKQGSPVSADWLSYDVLGMDYPSDSKWIAAVKSGPDKFSDGSVSDAFRDERTRTVSFEASYTSQVTLSHLLNAGVQFNSYELSINNRTNTREVSGGMGLTQYSAHPYEAALFVQDKMEFQGMIANAGLRWDLWAENDTYFTDLFSPYRVKTPDTTYYDPAASPTARTPILGRLQPRVGVSFPVTVSTVFHLNYGSFMQRPSFQYVVARGWSQGTGLPTTFGNPRLQPQTTNSYDVGVTQGLGEGFTLDVSGYYKDVKNLIQSAVFTDRSGEAYTTYVNRDYADIRGFRISFNKRRGHFTGAVNYQYSVATGKSSTPFNASPAYQEEPNTGRIIADLQNVPVKDIVLDFDRSHNLIINLAYTTGEEWGPRVLSVYPFAQFTVSSSSFARSGRPYTYSIGIKQINNMRTPAEYNTNLRISKKADGFFGTGMTLYLEIFNLFDQKILNYSYIFDQANSNSNFNITHYQQYAINDPVNGLRFINASNATPFQVDQSFLIYDNAPRSINAGIVVEF